MRNEKPAFVHDVARAILARHTPKGLEGRNASYFVLNEHPTALGAASLALIEELRGSTTATTRARSGSRTK